MESRLQTCLHCGDLRYSSESLMQPKAIALISGIPRRFLIMVGFLLELVYRHGMLSRRIISMITLPYRLFLHMTSKTIHHLSPIYVSGFTLHSLCHYSIEPQRLFLLPEGVLLFRDLICSLSLKHTSTV